MTEGADKPGVQLLSGPIQIELKNELKQPAAFANAVALNSLNESLVFSFGYFDPLTIKREPDIMKATATVFAQIVVPRTSFGPWLITTMNFIRAMTDRDTFGWSELAKIFAEERVEK